MAKKKGIKCIRKSIKDKIIVLHVIFGIPIRRLAKYMSMLKSSYSVKYKTGNTQFQPCAATISNWIYLFFKRKYIKELETMGKKKKA